MLSFLVSRALASILDEADRPLVILDRLRISGRGVEPIDSPEQPGFRIARIGETIGRLCDFIRFRGLDDIGGHDDHEFGFLLLVVVRAKQRAENRQVEEAWKTVDDLLRSGLEKSRGGDGAARRNLDTRLVLAGEKCRDGCAVDDLGVLFVYFGRFGRKMKQDAALGQNHGGKPQSNAIMLELGADLANSITRAAGRGWNRYFAANGELRNLARNCGNRGLRDDARNAIALEGL